jgi:hypothetical protein
MLEKAAGKQIESKNILPKPVQHSGI